jgi:hypothetical protein
MITYVGSAFYCYADSASMLLASAGQRVSSSRIEVLCGVGLGAMWVPDVGMFFLNNLTTPPDKGITQALELLGWRFTERSSSEAAMPPFEQLAEDLMLSPVVLGPLDMGFLKYNPLWPYLRGADHYVLAYALGAEECLLHDPAGFPYVSLPLDDLGQAWKAESIRYRRGHYRCWTALRRQAEVSEDELYRRALGAFQASYRISENLVANEEWAAAYKINEDAILNCAGALADGACTQALKAHLGDFVLRLGAKRALDFASFFEPHAPELAALKEKQARLLGRSHTAAVREDWKAVARGLREVAGAEEEFRSVLLSQ